MVEEKIDNVVKKMKLQLLEIMEFIFLFLIYSTLPNAVLNTQELLK